jgi:PBSX family phage portal protein
MSEVIEYSFGDPEPMIGGWRDMASIAFDPFNDCYTPPLLPAGLDKLKRSNAVHGRCINFKTGQMAIVFVQNGLLSLRDFRRAASDLETFGNAYFLRVENVFGQLLALRHVPALNMRVMKDGRFKYLKPLNVPDVIFDTGQILHAMHYDTGQDRYGVPSWAGSLNDIFLNSEATLFRRRYYGNGSHMGYILYTTDPKMDKTKEKEIADQVRAGKGVGNFRSMYINIPNGKEKAVQVIPVGDISQKDEFERVKNISADDILIGHGVQPSLAAAKPDNTGGFGDIEKIERFYRRNDVPGLVFPFEELNEQLPPDKRFQFDFTAGMPAVS